MDDALSVRELPNGNLELGVHIADVTHFVKPGSLTDLEARSRSTTVYLADRRYDMLPGVLRCGSWLRDGPCDECTELVIEMAGNALLKLVLNMTNLILCFPVIKMLKMQILVNVGQLDRQTDRLTD